MMKAFSFFALMLVGTSILVATMAGGSGLASEPLVLDSGATIKVANATSFNSSGILWVGYEKMHYTTITASIPGGTLDTFNVNVRGVDGTESVTHPAGAWVRADDNYILNSVFDFDVGQLVDTWGLLSFPAIVGGFFVHTVPAMLQGNIGGLFQGNGLAIVVDLWLVFGAGFVFMLIMTLINARRQ